MESESLLHVLLVSFPAQGHVNPLLRLGKCLASKGLLITFSTTETIGKSMRKANNIANGGELSQVGHGYLRFEFFEDGWDENDPRRRDLDMYFKQIELVGKHFLPGIIKRHAEQDLPAVSCIINNPFIPWVSDVAESLGIPSAMLWIQSCASFSSYYHYFHGLVPFPSESEPSMDVQLPCMPLLKNDEIPSFLHPSSLFLSLKKAILGQFKNLEKPFFILIDTFEQLENEIIDSMSKLCPIMSVGPLFKNPSFTKLRGDFTESDDECLDWLDSKPPSSVVYISFGSVVHLKQNQVDEIAHGILNSGVSFLWVMKPPRIMYPGYEVVVLPDGFLEKVGDAGKVVQWSPQEEVLAHPSVGCFMTHCGWNSSMEALASGVPVVAFPQWGDQVTNAKFLVEEFKIGVRICRGEAEKRLISRVEVERCLMEAMVGCKAEEMKRKALKWKVAAEKAVEEGGSSYRNIQVFVDHLRKIRTSM
ncbi:hypothetical protein FEM48_Zijuj04G0115300 [Ziziphus jujuba var. spinosa]|uniref:Glycosyltransferase n=1 Tax=Ziziphus jujuba var. spinosa TaxID=714518 RepID=A0A978VJM3_ZIZJJ|nr:hypothetical protein FEM48_Zijuj04G0115300 [Ziziphus jujuba var. spinosa]